MDLLGLSSLILCVLQISGTEGLQVTSDDDTMPDFDAETLTVLESPPFYEDTMEELSAALLYPDLTETEPRERSAETLQQYGSYWKALKDKMAVHRSPGMIQLFSSQTEEHHPTTFSSKLKSLGRIVHVLQQISQRTSDVSPSLLPLETSNEGNPSAYYDDRMIDSFYDKTGEGVAKISYKHFREPHDTKSKHQKSDSIDYKETNAARMNAVLEQMKDIMGSLAKKTNNAVQDILGQTAKEGSSKFNSGKRGVLPDYPGLVGDNGGSTQMDPLFVDNKKVTSVYDDNVFQQDTLLSQQPTTTNNTSDTVLDEMGSDYYANSDVYADKNGTTLGQVSLNSELLIIDHNSTMLQNLSDSNEIRNRTELNTAEGDINAHGTRASGEPEVSAPVTAMSATTMPTTKEPGFHIDDLVSNALPIEFYKDVCQSRNGFEIISTAINDHLENVEVLPNTWVWSSKCVSPSQPCSAIGPEVKALCRQKKGWVQAFARLHSRDPWRWHWIAVDTGCSCGVQIER